MKRFYRICLLLALASCQREAPVPGEGEIRPGEAVAFTTLMPAKAQTKADPTEEETAFNARMAQYKAVADAYRFTVEMYQKDGENADELLGSADYEPVTPATADGSLAPAEGSTPLYWPGNAKAYAFRATAGTATLETDQSDAASLLAQDRLLGYGFEPLWNVEGDTQVDAEGALNYRTSKEWYAANRQTRGMAPGGVDDADWYKKIPLYFQHQRSLITVRLKAGEGVDREALKTLGNISTTIYSYSGETGTAITPYGKETVIDYAPEDYGGAAEDVPTSEYTAIVLPYDYRTNSTTDVIAEISLSGQRFTFFADNDSRKADASHMENYNLTAGKHLVITVNLGRESRKILITAYIEDWTETVTSSVVDDYGQAGDPIQINNRKELYEFLTDESKNKPGNVAIVVPNSLNLEQSEGTPLAWDYDLTLNCTLNLAGATLFSDHRIFSTIGSSGTLVNGNVCIGNTAVTAAVAGNNLGTIERLGVAPKDNNGNNSTGYATVAGLSESNSGTIVGCSSVLPVQGSGTGFVGGIAARSVYSSDNGNTMPVIDGCTVNARVTGTLGVKGGGIVGEAVGRVTHNTFDYGITLLQSASDFKNIIQAKASGDTELRAYGNAWPTKAGNTELGEESSNPNVNQTPEEYRYDATIENQAELEALLTGTYNQTAKYYRLSNDFAVSGWNKGRKSDDLTGSGEGNVFFKLDGNGKTITTDGMLFSNIQNEIHDLTVRLGGNLVATPPAGSGDPDAIAALGYSVYGTDGVLRNIQVKAGSFCLQASTVGGLVVWAYGGATIENCQCKAKIQVWVQAVGNETKMYSGGIAAVAARAHFTRCVFHNADNTTLYRNSAAEYTTLDGSPEETPNAGIFYGGILGGTAPKGTGTIEYPSVTMTDCTSWFTTGNSPQWGSLIGYSQYSEDSVLKNGMADGCQGNWWPEGSRAIGTRLDGKTMEQTIGKRNAVTPVRDTNYDPDQD